MEVDY